MILQKMVPAWLRKYAVTAFATVLFGLSAQALVVDRDMTITTPPSGIEFAGDYKLTIAAEMYTGEITNDGHKATICLDNCKVQIRWITGRNGSYTRVEFNGGAFTDGGGWGSSWFFPDETSTIELASIDGKPIQIMHPYSQWKYLTSGKGKVITSGTGRFEVTTMGLAGNQILYCYLNIPSANYGHTGGTLLRGNTEGIIGNMAFKQHERHAAGRCVLG